MIGFGDAEKILEEKVEQAIRDFVRENYPREVGYFNESFVGDVGEYVNELSKESQTQADEYKTAPNHPDRYSYFWATTFSDAGHIVFILRFHHINRRHALSADGWGMMTSERLFYVSSTDIARELSQAAGEGVIA